MTNNIIGIFKFSPIKNQAELLKAVEYVHIACFDLCYKAFGEYLSVAGNVGIFCHYDDEFIELTKLRQLMADETDNWNQKYYRLYKPITISSKNNIPETVYTHLYIRKPDEDKPEVGDIDLVVSRDKFEVYKKMADEKGKIGQTDALYRPDLDMIRISQPNVDVLLYITTTFMSQK